MTTYVKGYRTKNAKFLIADCPGFLDSRGEEY